MFSSIWNMCCANRNKDDATPGRGSISQRPAEYIKTSPGLVKVLNVFNEIEERFRESMVDVDNKIDNIITELDAQARDEIIDVGNGQEIKTRVVDRDVVADILNFGSHRSRLM